MPSDPTKLRPSQTLQDVLERIREKAAQRGSAMPSPISSTPPPRHWQDDTHDQDDDGR